jgi:hypothetical protein
LRGLLIVSPLIHLGSVLHACENLDGFDGVLRRLKTDERSAQSELRFAARLLEAGLTPILEPSLGSKVLDSVVEFKSQQVYCEVIAPETSDAMQQMQEVATELGSRIIEQNTGRRVEVLLDGGDIEHLVQPLLDSIRERQPSGVIEVLAGIGRVSITETHGSLDVGPIIPGESDGVVQCAIRVRHEGNLRTAAIIRTPVSDERAKKLLYAESHHFSKDEMNVLVMDVTAVPGAIKGWSKLVERCLQPTQNRRIGAVLLFSSRMDGGSASLKYDWRAIKNQHAYKAIPDAFIRLIVSAKNDF